MHSEKTSGPFIKYSFVVPVYNEQEVIEKFHERLTAVADGLGENYEIVMVDDGSTDDTPDLLAKLAQMDRHVKVVEFSRNFGHQVAITAGYDFAEGQAVICLDADCQHPPELIPQLIEKWTEGYEVVYTVREDTSGISPIRRGLGRMVYRFIRLVSGSDLADQADFRLMDRCAVRALRTAREQARFVRGLVKWIGFRQIGVKYKADERAAGQSKYSLRQLARMAGAGIFNFSLGPLRLAGFLGAIMVAAALIYAILAPCLWAFGLSTGPWWTLSAAIVGIFGLQFVLIGVLGEYVGRTFEESKSRPLYVIRHKLGFGTPQVPPTGTPQGAPQDTIDPDFTVLT